MATSIQVRDDESYMQRCLTLAREAAAAGEVPVGAVVVLAGEILGEGRNRTRERGNALAHAEMLALDHAFAVVGERADPGRHAARRAGFDRPVA